MLSDTKIGVIHNERLHMELEYCRIAVPFIVLPRPNMLLFLNANSSPSFQNKEMHIVARVLREYD